jgi:uncharacterized protein YebE (UPF0316 family)
MTLAAFQTLPWVIVLGIFLLRVMDMSLDTIRVLFVVRGRKGLAWVLGFFQSAIYILAITSVLANLDNPLNIISYAAGFATGNVVGMLIEERLAIGHIQMTIVSSRRGAVIADHLRSHGFAVTVIPARGKDGAVDMINCSVLRKEVDNIETIVLESDGEAFITAEDIRPVRRGFWGI